MNYLNAADVLPPSLFDEIQKYAGGALLYVPKAEAASKDRGEISGQKKYYQKRNRMMINKFKYGIIVPELAKEYSLSTDTVKKIVYSKKDTEENMKWQVHPEVYEDRVQCWREKIRSNMILPPVIVGYTAGTFEINCNNPLFEALLRENVTYYPVIMWCTSELDYTDFMQKYSPYTDFVLK